MRGKCTINIPSIKKIWIEEVSMNDMVNHPVNYTNHPSGVEVIQITEHMNFCLGNAIKYLMRSEYKGKQIEDLKKAIWYISREIERIENGKA